MQIDIEHDDGQPFSGAKLALYLGRDLAVILRDDKPGLIFADHWDLPGGGREGSETPKECALRECYEELGLIVPQEALIWGRKFNEGTETKWFFVAQLPHHLRNDVVFGDEGQRWCMMSERDFLCHKKAVPSFQDRLGLWIAQRDAMP